jgi:hypothetical protein
VLRAAGEIEITQENIQEWVELDVGDPGFQLVTGEVIAAVIFLYLFSSPLTILLIFSIFCFLSFFCCLLGLSFAALIWMTHPPNQSG